MISRFIDTDICIDFFFFMTGQGVVIPEHNLFLQDRICVMGFIFKYISKWDMIYLLVYDL